jgi:hypothetical protein
MYLDTDTEIAKDISLDVCILCLCKSEETQGYIYAYRQISPSASAFSFKPNNKLRCEASGTQHSTNHSPEQLVDLLRDYPHSLAPS